MTIDEAVEKFHWFKLGEDGVPEMYLDHHSLSTFRMCEAGFELAHMGMYRRKGQLPWSLAFGIVFHKAIEYLYESKAINTFNPGQLMEIAARMWDEAGLDAYSEHKTYKALNGKFGFTALLMQYAQYYSGEAERLRPIATEIAFGKNKEVPLGAFTCVENVNKAFGFCFANKVRCYLTGRIDFLMDSGNAIGAMDHKTAAFFKCSPIENYEPQEGMTGYIYATNYIIKQNFPELAKGRMLDRMWMNFIQVKDEPDPLKRFKRVPIYKTQWQLEEFRLSQLATFEKIFSLVTTGRRADWNTTVCNNYWHASCQFKNVHRQGSESAMFAILNQDFEVKPAWDPENCED
jgi:hypothetical protein